MKLKILFRCALASLSLMLTSCNFLAVFIATYANAPELLDGVTDTDNDGVSDLLDPEPGDPNVPYNNTPSPSPFVALSPSEKVTQTGPRALAAVSEIMAESFGFPVVISLPITFQTTDAKGATVIKKRILKNKELINLLKGRDLKTPVSKTERIVALLPTDFTHPEKANIVLYEAGDQPKLELLLQGDRSSLIFGGPTGDSTASFGDGRLVSMSSPGFSIDGISRLNISTLGGEKSAKKVPVQKTKALTVCGRLVITDGDGTKTALITGGTVIIAGKPLVVVRK